MRQKSIHIWILLGVLGVQTVAAAAPEFERPSAPLITDEHKNTVTFGSAAYNLVKRNQDWNLTGAYSSGGCVFWIICGGSGYRSSPLSNQFDTSSRDVYSIAYERHFKHSFSVGLTYFRINNSFVIPSVTPSQGEVKTKFYFATITKYFGRPGGLQPLIGAGIGRVSTNVGGYINKSANREAAQAIVGLNYKYGRINFIAEYRYVYAFIKDGLSSKNQYTGSVFGDLDLSGHGPSARLGISF